MTPLPRGVLAFLTVPHVCMATDARAFSVVADGERAMSADVQFITERAEEIAKAVQAGQEAGRADDRARLRDVVRRLVKARSDFYRALQALDATWKVTPAAVTDIIDFDYPCREFLSDAEADQLAEALEAEVRRTDVG